MVNWLILVTLKNVKNFLILYLEYKMDLLNRFTLNLVLDILPDGVLSTLSNQSKLVNNLIYYD